ncbi:hypothetical protein D9M70_485740 [compost metagenome]
MSAGHSAYIHVHAFERTADLDRRTGGEWALGQGLVTMMQGLAVAQGFLGRRIGMAVAVLGVLKEQVRGGDDTFDLGAVLGFQ